MTHATHEHITPLRAASSFMHMFFTAGVIGALAVVVWAPHVVQAEGAHTQSAKAVDATTATNDANAAPLATLPIQRATLDNGLRVVMSPDHASPSVAVAVYYDVGSRNEVKGRSGFAHLFEHMMFQGSANVGKFEHFQHIQNRGGDVNGTTSADRTNYYETLPSNELALGLWLEADRMRSLKVTQANFENQRQTVMEERRQNIDNQPYVPSMLHINELAYGDYWPYAHSTIGDMADLQAAPLSAVQKFFEEYYAPNNAVIGIAGDFDPDEAMKLVKTYFGDIPARERPAYAPEPFAEQAAAKFETMYDKNATLPAFHMAYHIPPMRSDDHYALEMLAMVLGHGNSSRLHQKLVKELELAQQVSVATDDRRGPDLLSVWCLLANGHAPDEALKVVRNEFEQVKREGITERELQRIKNQIRSMFIFGLQTNLARAKLLAEHELYYGDAALIRGEPARYQAVTVDDIKRVAQRYLTTKNETVLVVQPGEDPNANNASTTSASTTLKETH